MKCLSRPAWAGRGGLEGRRSQAAPRGRGVEEEKGEQEGVKTAWLLVGVSVPGSG